MNITIPQNIGELDFEQQRQAICRLPQSWKTSDFLLSSIRIFIQLQKLQNYQNFHQASKPAKHVAIIIKHRFELLLL